MTLSETIDEGIIYVAISGESFHSLPGVIYIGPMLDMILTQEIGLSPRLGVKLTVGLHLQYG